METTTQPCIVAANLQWTSVTDRPAGRGLFEVVNAFALAIATALFSSIVVPPESC